MKLLTGSKPVTVSYFAVGSSDKYLRKAIQSGQDVCVQFGRVTQKQKKDLQSCLIYVQQQECCRNLVHETISTYNKVNSITPTALKNNMQLLVLQKKPQAPLGPPMLLSMRVRGRGDCLYRALEQIILSTTAVRRMREFRKFLGEGIEHVTEM